MVSVTVRGARSSFVLRDTSRATTRERPRSRSRWTAWPAARRCSERCSRTSDPTRPDWRGRSPARRCEHAHGSTGNASTRRRTANDSTSGSRNRCVSAIMRRCSLQGHIVHEGGQLFAAGPVRDSSALAAGVALHGAIADGLARVAAGCSACGVTVRARQERPDLDRDGRSRASAAQRSSDTDGAVTSSPGAGGTSSRTRAIPTTSRSRGAAIAIAARATTPRSALTRRFTLAPAAILDVSARVHRVERHYEYSYRIVSIVTPSWRVR